MPKVKDYEIKTYLRLREEPSWQGWGRRDFKRGRKPPSSFIESPSP